MNLSAQERSSYSSFDSNAVKNRDSILTENEPEDGEINHRSSERSADNDQADYDR